jgi:hypothetical protein
MNVVAITGVLATAVAYARRSADPRAKIDALTAVLVRAEGDGIEVVGHNLENCQASIVSAAAVYEAGAVAVSADRLAGVLGAMPGDLEVALATSDAVLTVSAGRSRYRLATLPVEDFPTPLAVSGDATSFTLSPPDASPLLDVVAAASDDAVTRDSQLGGCRIKPNGASFQHRGRYRRPHRRSARWPRPLCVKADWRRLPDRLRLHAALSECRSGNGRRR